jgi:hypothetical protein
MLTNRMCYWSETNPQQLHEKPLHSARVTVWCGISASQITRPCFFFLRWSWEHNHSHFGAVCKTTDQFPYSWITSFWCRSVYFQQDWATVHTAQETLSTLCTVFVNRIGSHYWDIPWAARSPDLPACDFFLWGYLKSRVSATRIPDLQTLKARIQESSVQFHTGCWHLWWITSFVKFASEYHKMAATYMVWFSISKQSSSKQTCYRLWHYKWQCLPSITTVYLVYCCLMLLCRIYLNGLYNCQILHMHSCFRAQLVLPLWKWWQQIPSK